MLKLSYYKFFTIFLLNGCTTVKSSFFSYTVNSYKIDSQKKISSTSRLISYGNYLLEFKIRTNFIDTIREKTKTIYSYLKYDTIGVYLLSLKNRNYFEFDTFSLKNKIIKTGKIFDKEFGYKFSESNSKSSSNFFDDKNIKDTIINQVPCFYTDTIIKNIKDRDSLEIKYYFIKDSNFNSIYKIDAGFKNVNKYCLFGFYIFSFADKDAFSQEIESLRSLNQKEINICESMILKTGIK